MSTNKGRTTIQLYTSGDHILGMAKALGFHPRRGKGAKSKAPSTGLMLTRMNDVMENPETREEIISAFKAWGICQ